MFNLLRSTYVTLCICSMNNTYVYDNNTLFIIDNLYDIQLSEFDVQ